MLSKSSDEVKTSRQDSRQDSRQESFSRDSRKSGQKWETLYHNGPNFPEPYVPLPDDVRILYKGEPVKLPISIKNEFNVSAEEAAVFYALKLILEEKKGRAVDEGFRDNFFDDWKTIMKSSKMDVKIKHVEKVDFSPIVSFLKKEAETKKFRDKKSLDEKKKAIQEKYGYALVDGVRTKVGAYTIEPPSLYAGHGSHPKRGRIKRRVSPDEITINVSLDGIPECQINGKKCEWKQVVSKKDAVWLAQWKNNITERTKYIYLDRNESEFVVESDKQKFEKARKLLRNITEIREKYTRDMESSGILIKQLSTAVYLLDVIAIRPSTEKDEETESNTLGLTTLLVENIEIKDSKNVSINFLGKSSIPYIKTVKVSKQAVKNLTELMEDKRPTDQLFNLVDANRLNIYLSKLVPNFTELTSKVFRTFKACTILEQVLSEIELDETASQKDKKLAFEQANIQVADALNHKTLTTSTDRVKKIQEKKSLIECRECKTEKQEKTRQESLRQIESRLQQAEGNISLGTSKQNYIDPRIVVAWCKKNDVAIEKIYPMKTLEKFEWSMDTKMNWKF